MDLWCDKFFCCFQSNRARRSAFSGWPRSPGKTLREHLVLCAKIKYLHPARRTFNGFQSCYRNSALWCCQICWQGKIQAVKVKVTQIITVTVEVCRRTRLTMQRVDCEAGGTKPHQLCVSRLVLWRCYVGTLCIISTNRALFKHHSLSAVTDHAQPLNRITHHITTITVIKRPPRSPHPSPQWV